MVGLIAFAILLLAQLSYQINNAKIKSRFAMGRGCRIIYINIYCYVKRVGCVDNFKGRDILVAFQMLC